MRVIKNKQIIEDNWERLTDLEGQSLPAGDLIIPFRYWQDHQQQLQGHKGKLAICLDGNDATEDVVSFLDKFDLIALDFPAFTDGRSYTHARLLRERYNYKGELRAVGDVLRDQLFFMQRCGIDSFQLREDKDIQDALNAFTDFTVKYQSAADGTKPIYKYR